MKETLITRSEFSTDSTAYPGRDFFTWAAALRQPYDQTVPLDASVAVSHVEPVHASQGDVDFAGNAIVIPRDGIYAVSADVQVYATVPVTPPPSGSVIATVMRFSPVRGDSSTVVADSSRLVGEYGNARLHPVGVAVVLYKGDQVYVQYDNDAVDAGFHMEHLQVARVCPLGTVYSRGFCT